MEEATGLQKFWSGVGALVLAAGVAVAAYAGVQSNESWQRTQEFCFSKGSTPIWIDNSAVCGSFEVVK